MEVKKFNRLLKKIHKSRNAVIKIYNCFYPLIVIHINKCFRGKLDGNDIAQQFFVKLLNMDVKEYINYPVSWVNKISYYIAIESLRKRDKRKTAESRAAVKDVAYDSNNSQEILDCLDGKHRQIIYLYFWERYTLIEISRIMEINYSTLKSMYKNAKNILKEKIEKE